MTPVELKTRLQVVVGSIAVHVATPSVTVTVPVGVPMPGGLTAIVKVTTTVCPTVDVTGFRAVIVVVVFAAFT